MKRVKLLLIAVLVAFMFPVGALADDEGPTIVSYEVRVSKEEGTSLLNSKLKEIKSIPHDTILTVTFEVNLDGKLYGEVYYEKKSGYVLLEDVVPNDPNFEFDFEDYVYDLYVFDRGVYLYNGPSIIYGVNEEVGEIPVGTVFEDAKVYETWAYVEYKGYKGWLYYSNNVAYKDKDIVCGIAHGDITSTYAFKKDVVLLNKPSRDADVISNIKAYETFEQKYDYYDAAGNLFVLVNYKGAQGWTEFDYDYALDAARPNSYIYTFDNVDMYDGNKKVGTIPADKKVPVLFYNAYAFSDGNEYYVDYKGIKGIVTLNTKKLSFAVTYDLVEYDYMYNVEIHNGNFLKYDKVNGTKTGDVIENGTIVKILYYCETEKTNKVWYYFDGEYSGWYTSDGEAYLRTTEEEIPEKPQEEEKPEVGSEPKEENKKLPIPVREMALYFSVGAVVLSLTTVVIILLVNKKKQEKETKEEKVVEEPVVETPTEEIKVETEEVPIEPNVEEEKTVKIEEEENK